MKIELYTEVNFRGPTAKNGKCIALVECETKKGPAVKAQIENEQNTTYHRMSMIAILVGLRMLRPCEVTVYTPDQMEKHRVTLEFSESTRYSDRLQSKMR